MGDRSMQLLVVGALADRTAKSMGELPEAKLLHLSCQLVARQGEDIVGEQQPPRDERKGPAHLLQGRDVVTAVSHLLGEVERAVCLPELALGIGQASCSATYPAASRITPESNSTQPYQTDQWAKSSPPLNFAQKRSTSSA
jgi:hypothetical protein